MRALGRLRPRLTYANVVSTLCLFILLGGTAWAVAANSVGTAQLKNGAVTTPKIHNGAVRSDKVADHSLLAQDLAPGQVGPRQFDDHVDQGKVLFMPKVNGIGIRVICGNFGSKVEAAFYAQDSSNDVGVSGFAEVDGTFKAITAQDRGTSTVVDSRGASGGAAANFDVLARNVQSPNKWTHWVVGLYTDGTHGCGVWGNVDPPSN